MKNCLIKGLLINFLLIAVVVVAFDFTFETIDVKSPKKVEGEYEMKTCRIKKLNRTAFVLDFEMATFTDFDQRYDAKVDIFYSRLGNSQYVRSAANIEKTEFCKFMKDVYKPNVMVLFKENTNLPQVPEKSDESPCPVKMGSVWAKNLQISTDVLPKWAPEGRFRIEFTLWKGDNIVLEIHCFAKIEHSTMTGFS